MLSGWTQISLKFHHQLISKIQAALLVNPQVSHFLPCKTLIPPPLRLRSYFGYPPVRDALPNTTHHALAALQHAGIVSHLITQVKLPVPSVYKRILTP